MANTITGMYNDNVARVGLSAYASMLAPLSAFSLNLSADAASQGLAVKTRIVPVTSGTVGDLVTTHTGLYTDAIDDVAMTAVDVSLSAHPVMCFALTDSENNEVESGVMSDTLIRMIKSNAYAISTNVLATVWATIDTTYATGVSAVAASAFDADDVADLRTYCSMTSAWHFGEGDETLILDSNYYGALRKDNAIQDLSASGLNTLQSGMVSMCNGFKCIEAPTLAASAASNTGAFACKPAGQAIAMRGVNTQSSPDFMAFEIMQDDESDVVLTYSAWFDRNYKRVIHCFETLWGRADANTSAIVRVTSA